MFIGIANSFVYVSFVAAFVWWRADTCMVESQRPTLKIKQRIEFPCYLKMHFQTLCNHSNIYWFWYVLLFQDEVVSIMEKLPTNAFLKA